MLRKKDTYTVITPIPEFIPRQLAIDILHSHGEVISLNPLVLSHKPVTAPRNAAADEYYSTWYEITQKVQMIPGMGKFGAGQIKFNGCFHDMPWGLQTHIYITAPMSVDLRNKYRIGGNQPGIEPPEQRELGMENLGIPSNGLYLRQEAEIKCNIAMVSHVKNELKKASKDMVDRIIKKAELLDSGVLQAMFENGKLKTINPNDRSYLPDMNGPVPGATPLSPTGSFVSPQMRHASTFYNPQSVSPPPPQQSPQPYAPSYQAPPAHPKEQNFVLELPGDYMYANQNIGSSPQTSPALQSSHSQRSSYTPSDHRWSHMSQNPNDQNRMSMASSAGSAAGQPPRQYAAELASHTESREEYR